MNVQVEKISRNFYRATFDGRSVDLPLAKLLNFRTVQIAVLEKCNYIPSSTLRPMWPAWVRAQLERKIS